MQQFNNGLQTNHQFRQLLDQVYEKKGLLVLHQLPAFLNTHMYRTILELTQDYTVTDLLLDQ